MKMNKISIINKIFLIFLTILLFTSCKKKETIYYMDYKNVIHTDKTCEKILGGGIILIEKEKLMPMRLCGGCMSKEEIETCSYIMEYNQNMHNRERWMKLIATAAIRKYGGLENMPIDIVIDTLFINEENSKWIYDRICSGDIRLGFGTDSEILSVRDELLKLGKEGFVIRLKRWAKNGVTGFSEYDTESLLDEEFVNGESK